MAKLRQPITVFHRYQENEHRSVSYPISYPFNNAIAVGAFEFSLIKQFA